MSDRPTSEDLHVARWPGLDGSRWHAVAAVEGTPWGGRKLTAVCGATATNDELDDEAEEGEEPSELNGNTVCYSCINEGL